jgi:hypothetical protein
MMDWEKEWTRGPCEGCGETFSGKECRKGRCLPCRCPEDRRELVKFGVPWGSANALAGIMKKCNGDAEFVLGKVHPRLMQNIVISNGILKVRDKAYRWLRRNDWVKV